MSHYDFAEVKRAAAGRWLPIWTAAGIPPEILDGRHHPCHGCGGRDRFRIVTGKDDGFWICNGGGNRTAGDGFHLLQHALGMIPAESLRFVADYLGIAGAQITAADRARWRRRRILEELPHELQVLQCAIADHLAGRELNATDAAREQLAIARTLAGLEALR